tara:strand:+ start:394 stop:594 length:201 start_codon:yes stop_codon:yes gene_type:complete
LKKCVGTLFQLLMCSDAQRSKLVVRTEKYGMHLILRLGAVQTGTRFGGLCRILYAFGAIASMPTFV